MKGNMSAISFDYASKHRTLSGVSSDGHSKKVRLHILFGVAFLWCGMIVARLYSLQIANFATWEDWALRQHFADVEIASERGPILDRNDKLLATSIPAGSVYVRPRQISDKKKAAEAIGGELGMPAKQVLEKLEQKKSFVWVKRQISRSVAERVADLKIPGAGFVMEAKRMYPYNASASTVIGKVGIDGVGLSGVESMFEKYLHGEFVKTRVTRDAYGAMIEAPSTGSESFEVPKGKALKLTLDAAIQTIMDEEFQAGRETAAAKAVMGAMVDAGTGEVLAMSQSASTDFNSISNANPKNLVVESVFEPGSIMKPIVTAAAIDAGVVKPTDLVNCENGRYPFSTHTIKDVHPSGIISVADVLVRSSNIGMTKIGVKLGRDKLYQYLRDFGFGAPSNIGLPGDTRGILRPISSWAPVDVATHSFGQGVAVTPLQVVRAFSAIANGGILPSLQLIAGDGRYELKRVVSERAAEQVREMLFGVVEDEHGTGKLASIAGVRVGGKTGTAQKARPNGKGYMAGAYVASFVGFVDASSLGIHKNLVLIVSVDEPRGKSIYGGAVAAPIFKRTMQRTLHLLATREQLGGKAFAPGNQYPKGVSPVSYSKTS